MAGKEILSIVAILISIYGIIPYIIAIFRGLNKPHVFSWIIWSVSTGIA